MLHGDLKGEETQKRVDLHLHIAGSLCCTSETNTTLLSQLNSNLKFFKKHKGPSIASSPHSCLNLQHSIVGLLSLQTDNTLLFRFSSGSTPTLPGAARPANGILSSWDAPRPHLLLSPCSPLEIASPLWLWLRSADRGSRWLSGLLSQPLFSAPRVPHVTVHSPEEPSTRSAQGICASAVSPAASSSCRAPKRSPFFHLCLCLDPSRFLYLRYLSLFRHPLPLKLPWLFLFLLCVTNEVMRIHVLAQSLALDYNKMSVTAGTLFTGLVP